MNLNCCRRNEEIPEYIVSVEQEDSDDGNIDATVTSPSVSFSDDYDEDEIKKSTERLKALKKIVTKEYSSSAKNKTNIFTRIKEIILEAQQKQKMKKINETILLYNFCVEICDSIKLYPLVSVLILCFLVDISLKVCVSRSKKFKGLKNIDFSRTSALLSKAKKATRKIDEEILKEKCMALIQLFEGVLKFREIKHIIKYKKLTEKGDNLSKKVLDCRNIMKRTLKSFKMIEKKEKSLDQRSSFDFEYDEVILTENNLIKYLIQFRERIENYKKWNMAIFFQVNLIMLRSDVTKNMDGFKDVLKNLTKFLPEGFNIFRDCCIQIISEYDEKVGNVFLSLKKENSGSDFKDGDEYDFEEIEKFGKEKEEFYGKHSGLESSVFLVKCRETKRKYALKRILNFEDQSLAKFNKTLNLNHGILHENVLTCQKFFITENDGKDVEKNERMRVTNLSSGCFIFPRISMNLKEKIISIQKNGSIPKLVFLSYLVDLLEGIQSIKENEVVHRNITPQVVFVDKKNRLLIGGFELHHDFKKGNEKDFITSCTERKFNQFHLPPEVTNVSTIGEKIDYSKTDVFSVGLIAYRMIRKSDPFRGVKKRKFSDYSPLTEKECFFSKQIVELIEKMVHPEISRRMNSEIALRNATTILSNACTAILDTLLL